MDLTVISSGLSKDPPHRHKHQAPRRAIFCPHRQLGRMPQQAAAGSNLGNNTDPTRYVDNPVPPSTTAYGYHQLASKWPSGARSVYDGVCNAMQQRCERWSLAQLEPHTQGARREKCTGSLPASHGAEAGNTQRLGWPGWWLSHAQFTAQSPTRTTTTTAH